MRTGCLQGDVDDLQTAVNKTAKLLQRERQKGRCGDRTLRMTQSETSGLPTVKSAVPAAPVSDQAVIPANYKITASGIYHDRETDEGTIKTTLVAPVPVFVVGRLVSNTDETESLRIAWSRDGRWKARDRPPARR
jgi:hypothetical protein